MAEYAIIVAGGKGTRMDSEIPKQFLPIKGVPILVRTIRRFIAYSESNQIVLGLPAEDVPHWKSISTEHGLNKYPITLVKGGKTRFQTVKNCLDAIEGNEGYVAIHDGVRPLVDPNIIKTSFSIAAIHKTAVASVRLKESLRRTTQDLTIAEDRSLFRLIQTPQTFDLSLIRKAYEVDEEDWMTDDASVAEKAGYRISLFEGSYRNIKITTPSDLKIASALVVD